jgi:hypothetical protein
MSKIQHREETFMAENGRLYELVAEMLVEIKLMRQDFNNRIERLEEAQKTTNILLQQHGRDLINIANILSERVVHWGDKAIIGTGSKKIVGNIIKVS